MMYVDDGVFADKATSSMALFGGIFSNFCQLPLKKLKKGSGVSLAEGVSLCFPNFLLTVIAVY